MANQEPRTTHQERLPEDVVLRVSGVSKKFCRNLRRSMWYGIQDLSKNLLGKTEDRRLKTEDFLGGEASSSVDAEQGLQSSVFSLIQGLSRI
jgi:hypothetical protein